ncbi:MAG: hypothetical protein Q8880_13110, partial [Bacteroidota bacterium]|nr:hypothetical protein [Bacteroidota bacterium]
IFVTVFAVGCSDDDTESLRFYDEAYEVPIHGTRNIGIKSGSGDYTLQVENTGLFTASEDKGWSNPAGVLLVRGLLTGESTLIVKDNRTGETTKLKIKVTNNYEALHVSVLKNDQPILSKMPYIFLINNKSRDMYFADSEGERSITNNGLRIRGKGNYSFTMEDNKPYLTLIYATDDKGDITDDATIAPVSHKFLLTQSSGFVLHRLDVNLNLGWETAAGNYSEDQSSLVIKMEQANSDYKIEGMLVPVEIPKGILK